MKVNTKSCEYLVNKYKNLVYKLANRLYYGKVEFEDLVQAGFMGLVAASNNFDFTKGDNFISYASIYIINEIKRENRKASIFKTSDYILKLKSKVDKLEGLDILELADYLNTSTENILIAKNLNNEIISFNEIEDTYISAPITFNTIHLSKEELVYYNLKYVNHYTQKEISKRLNISQSTVSRKLKEIEDKIC